MRRVFDKILLYLKKHNRPVVKLLQEGLTNNQIEEIISSTNLEFPEDFFELYSSCNGTLVKESDILDDLHFFPGFYFLSLEDAMNDYKILLDSGNWNKNWFPIFANGGGDYFCIDCTKGKEFPIIGYIIGYHDDDLRDYLNLYAMFETIAECFEKEAYFLDIDNDYLEADVDKERIIGRKNNPGLKRWD